MTNVLDRKISELEDIEEESRKKIEMLNMDMKKTRPSNNADRQKDIKCKDCDKRCEGKTKLRKHMMDTHPTTYS